MKDQETQQQKHPISNMTFVFMLAISGVTDAISVGISFIPIIGNVINTVLIFCVLFALWLWFAFKGLGMEAALWGVGGTTLSIIPVVEALPLVTAVVLTVYARSRVDETLPITPKKSGGQRGARRHSPAHT